MKNVAKFYHKVRMINWLSLFSFLWPCKSSSDHLVFITFVISSSSFLHICQYLLSSCLVQSRVIENLSIWSLKFVPTSSLYWLIMFHVFRYPVAMHLYRSTCPLNRLISSPVLLCRLFVGSPLSVSIAKPNRKTNGANRKTYHTCGLKRAVGREP